MNEPYADNRSDPETRGVRDGEPRAKLRIRVGGKDRSEPTPNRCLVPVRHHADEEEPLPEHFDSGEAHDCNEGQSGARKRQSYRVRAPAKLNVEDRRDKEEGERPRKQQRRNAGDRRFGHMARRELFRSNQQADGAVTPIGMLVRPSNQIQVRAAHPLPHLG